MKRLIIIVVASLLLLGVVSLIGVRVYLGTNSARLLIVEQLAAQLGGKVQIDSLVVSTFGSSRVRGIRVADGDEPDPFLVIDTVDADLSALSILFGRHMPSQLDADGVRILLRFDPSGKLLTKLPAFAGGGPTPSVHLRDGQLTLSQQGRPPLVVQGIELAMSNSEKETLTGHVEDPVFGTLSVTGHAGDALALSLRGTTPRITPAMLRDLPFVPSQVWQQIEAEGTEVPLELDFTFRKSAPEVVYRVGFGKARVRLLQPDRPALEVFPAKAVLGGAAGDFHLDGTIDDPYWGDWNVRVREAADNLTRIDLDTPSTNVDQQKLQALPYVPKHVWEEVRATGKTGVKVAVRLPADGTVKYRVDLDVSKADIGVTAIGLEATGAAGRVIVEDNLVKLEKVTGNTGKGQIATTADLDFRKPPSKMAFAVDIKGVDLHELPKKWELPKQIEGKLSGQANVVVTLRDGAGPDLRGSGEARIDEAKLAGFPTAKPITLSLQGDGKRFRFTPRIPVLSSILSMILLQAPVEMPVIARAAKADSIDEAVGQALGGVATLTRRVADGSIEGLRRLARVEKIMRSKETQYLDANVKLDDVDLAELAKRLELGLPFTLEGRLSLEILLGIPINDAASMKNYRLNGSASSSRLVVAGLEMRDLKARIDYSKGILRLGEFTGKVVQDKESGTFAGSARMQVVPRGELSVEGKIDALPATALARVVPALQKRLAGKLSGQVKAGVAVDKLADPAAWRGTAQVTSNDLQVFGVPLRSLSAEAVLAEGKATVKDAKAEVYKAPLTASGRFDLADTTYDATFRLKGADLARLAAQLPPGLGLQGSGDLTGSVKGSIQSGKLAGSGSIATRGVQVGKVRLEEVGADWALEGDTLRLSKISTSLYKGAATGSAEIQLGSAKGKVKVRLEKLDAAVLSKAIEGVPIKLEGQVTADADIEFEPAGARTKVVGHVDLSASKLRLQGISTQKLTGKIEWKGDALDYRLQGETLGGKFSVDGVYPPPPRSPAGQPHGWLRLDRLLLERIVRAARLGESWRHLSGVISLSFPYRFDGPDKVPVGMGRFEVRDLRWFETELVDQARGDIRLGRNGLSIREVDNTFAGGQLRVSGLYRFTQPPRGWFNVQLTGADAGTFLLLLGADKKRLQGPLDVSLRGEIGQEWRGSGAIALSRGQVSGVSVSGIRVPVDFTFTPSRRQVEFVGRDGVGQLGQGRAQLRGSLRVGESVHTEGSLTLLDAELGALAGLVGDVSSYLRGRISGRIDFSGSQMRSIEDLDANVRATLRDTQALQLPVLRQLTPYILPGQGARAFTTGELRGRLSRGVFRIGALTLSGNVAQLVILGTITVAGRLDLDVTAQTSTNRTGSDLVLVRLLARGVPAVGPVPVSLILRVSDALSNFVIHLRVTGTVKQPVIRVEPIRILSEDAVRLFLGQAVKVP